MKGNIECFLDLLNMLTGSHANLDENVKNKLVQYLWDLQFVGVRIQLTYITTGRNVIVGDLSEFIPKKFTATHFY